MSRATLDFGIDLGTTNSAIAVLRDGRPEPIRNNEQQEITPSAVMVDRSGALSIGLRAYRSAEIRPGSVAREFKRAMGTDQTFMLSGRTCTPEELSAEVLKVLRADVQARFGEELDAAVITVPASFSQAAKEATIRAAHLAGIRQAPLLQEPIAAGLAYSFEHTEATGYWVVYDLGGGTFDAALMTIRHGRLQVVDHAGDDLLGGKNFDHALLDHVVEQLRASYRIDGLVRRENDRYRRLYAKLKGECERAKIELSRQTTTVIELADVSDDDDEPIDAYIDVSRSTYEALIEQPVRRTTRIIRELLVRNDLEPAAVQRVIMVGGPTLTPYIRDRVRVDTGIEIETRLDPLTVVAQGAAIFAGAVRREEPAGPTAATSGDAVQIDLKYTPVVNDTEAHIGGRIKNCTEAGLAVQLERADGGWASPRVPVTNGIFVTTVVLKPNQANTFHVRLINATGLQLPVTPDQLSVRHGLVIDEPPLSHTIGIAVDAGDGVARTHPVLHRGTRLPAREEYVFRTTRALAPGQATGINLHVIEGQAAHADRNNHVGFIRLDGTNIERALPVGSELQVALTLDTSHKLTVRAFVPLLEETFDLIVEDTNRRTPDPHILQSELEIEEQRLAEVGTVAAVGDVPDLLVEVKHALAEACGGDHDAAMRAEQRLHDLQNQLDGIEEAASLPMLEAEWRELLPKTRQLLSECGNPAVRQQLLTLEREGHEAREARDSAQLKQKVEQLKRVYWGTQFEQPGFWIGVYQDMVELQEQMADPATARMLIRDGRVALDSQNFEGLRKVCGRLWELLDDRARGTVKHGLPDVGVRA